MSEEREQPPNATSDNEVESTSQATSGEQPPNATGGKPSKVYLQSHTKNKKKQYKKIEPRNTKKKILKRNILKNNVKLNTFKH